MGTVFTYSYRTMYIRAKLIFILLFFQIISFCSCDESTRNLTDVKTDTDPEHRNETELNETILFNASALVTASKVEMNLTRLMKNARRSRDDDIERSTSSESDDPKKTKREKSHAAKSENDGGFIASSKSESSDDSDSNIPKSTEERRGWRKWHRKCVPCPDDEDKKWKHPEIQWICGGYQHARRSFKSLCSMYLRNCQDGTMFVKLYDHRCKDDGNTSSPYLKHGDHFFYDYKVRVFSSNSDSEEESSFSDKSDTMEKDKYDEYIDNIIFKYIEPTTVKTNNTT